MKKFLTFLVVGFSISSMFASSLETPLELIADGDFDGDGRTDVVVLDKQTGAGRVGFQDAGRQLNWFSFASGIADATSLAVGRISSTSFDSIAVAGPGANRVNKLDLGDLLAANGISPTPIFPPGIGPSLVAAIDANDAGNTALADFFVVTTQNPGDRFAFLRNTGSTTMVLDQDALTRAMSSPGAFRADSSRPEWLGAILRANRFEFTDLFQAMDFSSGNVSIRLSAQLPFAGAEFIAHRFDSGNPLAQTLFYVPGDSDLTKFQIQQSGGYSLVASNRFRLSDRIQALQTIPLADGARFVAFFGQSKSNITSATVYDFDGVNAPRVVQSFAGNFSGAAMLGDGNLALLNADSSGKTLSHQIYLADLSRYRAGGSGILPSLNRFAGAANALLFDADPFVNSRAVPRQLFRHGDWSTSLRVTPTIRVTSQQFLGPTEGLGSSSSRDFGPPVSGVSTGLVNQYFSSISVFSGRPALGANDCEVRITPPAGHYGEAISVILTNSTPGNWQIFYRTSASQNWTAYDEDHPFLVISDATVEAYARRNPDGVPTAIARATYTFSQSLAQQDSDNDGVPDFVEQQRGLDPRGGADSDGDGFSDLEELARGTDPLSDASKPADSASLRVAFDRLVSPRPPNPDSGANQRPQSSVPMRVFTLGGSFLKLASTSILNGSGATNPAALFSNLLTGPGAQFVVETTPNHFDLNGTIPTRAGRELIGLVPVPPTNSFTVDFTFGNGSLATQAASWIAAASNAVKNAENPTVAGQLTVESALVAALFEAHSARALLARRTNGADHATLFGFRAGDADRRVISAEDLRNLEQYSGPNAPGYKQRAVFDFLDGQVRKNGDYATLLNFARELWRISAAENNDNEGAYLLPFDELRRLIAADAPSAAYRAFPSINTTRAAALAQATQILADIPSRPRTNVTLFVTSISSGSESARLRTKTGVPVQLWRFDGTPFVFPPNIQLLPGALIQLFAHADLAAPAGELAFEVISISLAAVPMPSPSDTDNNLLVDSWEEAFFGHKGADPFADADGDGYNNLEEMLAGTTPDDALQIPAGPPAQLTQPILMLDTTGAQLTFQFNWPSSLMSRFQFGLEASDRIEGPFAPASIPLVIPGADGIQRIEIPQTPAATQFYQLALEFLQ